MSTRYEQRSAADSSGSRNTTSKDVSHKTATFGRPGASRIESLS